MEIKRITTLKELEDLADAGALSGLFELPNELYHRGPGISSSGLKALLRSPAHYEQMRQSPPDSVAMRKGRAVHTWILEPQLFKSSYVVAPELDRRTTAGKALWEAFQLSAEGRQVLSADDQDLCMGIGNAVETNELAAQALLSPGGHNELSVYWTDKETGVLCKARADRIFNGLIFDLKTTQDAQPREFQRTIASYLYHLSAAFYFDGFSTVMDVQGFSWIPVEKSAPYGIAFYAASDETLAVGRAEYAQALRAYQAYMTPRSTGTPAPGYPQRFETISLPTWYQVKEAAV